MNLNYHAAFETIAPSERVEVEREAEVPTFLYFLSFVALK